MINKLYTKESSRNKKYVQQKIFDQISGLQSDVLCLAGPTPISYVSKIKKHVKGRITSYEKSGEVYHTQIALQGENKVLEKVKFLFGEIEQGEVTNFIDADFCCTLSKAAPTIKKLFNAQKQLKNKQRKVFCFTNSVMHVGYDNILPFLQDLLKIDITLDYIAKTNTHEEYLLIYNLKKYRISYYHYCDSSPLASICIQYY